MKKLFLTGAVALSLSACVSTQDVETSIAQVQSYTRLACAFVPTVETVAKILAAGNVTDTASAVANTICAAVTTRPLADGPGDRVPRVRGVVVKGKFVK